jgi:hypothetical protein
MSEIDSARLEVGKALTVLRKTGDVKAAIRSLTRAEAALDLAAEWEEADRCWSNLALPDNTNRATA